MRPRLLEIEGLQSFSDTQVIDFDTLGETGLFGIFGPTGSGKSTILDAITFALYGRVKRAENGTQGIINARCKTVRVAFTFDLARNGKRTTYRVERTYQRKKNSQNACEAKIARLIQVAEEGEIPLCDKATDVSSFVRELLGLGSEDFTRAVVLPQNSFHEFLMLKNSERRGMLERIFYLEEYGRLLTDKIARRMWAMKSRMDMLSGELKGYADASDEALEEVKKAMDAALKERSRTEKELKKLETVYNESKEVWNLVCELDDLARKEEAHKLSEQAITHKRMQLEKAVKADALADMIIKNRELEQKLKETEKQLEQVMNALPGVSSKLAEAKTLYDDLKREAAADQQKLVEQRTRLQDALGVRTEISALSARIKELQGSAAETEKAIVLKTSDIAAENTELERLKKELDAMMAEAGTLRTEPEYRQQIQAAAALDSQAAALAKSESQLTDRRDALKKTADEQQSRLDAIMKDIEAGLAVQEELAQAVKWHESEKPGDMDSVMKSMEKVHKAQGVYQLLKLREDEAGQAKSRADALKPAVEEMSLKAAEKDKARASAAEYCEQLRRELDECLRELDKHTAYMLSKRLKKGEPCPVCGSVEHPSPAVHNDAMEAAALEQKTEDARRKLTEAETALRDAERESLIASENLRAMTQQLEQAVKEAEQKDKAFDDERQKLPDEWKTLDIEQIRQKIEKADISARAKQRSIEEWEAKLSELKEQSEKQSNIVAGLRLSEKSISAELKVNNENLGRLEKELEEVSKELKKVRDELAVRLERHSIENASAELARLSENDRKLNLIEAETAKARKAAEEVKTCIDKLNKELSGLTAEKIRLETDISGLTAQKNEKEKKLMDLAGDQDIEEGISRIDNKLRRYAEADREFAQKIEELEKQYNELSLDKSKLDSQLSFYSESLAGNSEKLSAALSDNGFERPDEAESCMLPQEIRKALKAEIDAYDQESMSLKAQKGLLDKRLKSRTITGEEWSRIEQSYTELLEYSKKVVSDSEVAKNHYGIISRKHERWEELRRQFTEVSHRHGLYEQIQKLLKAVHGKDNSFIDYIAEERLRYVAAKASVILGVVTGHRYALELDTESGFIIRDDANGGIHRMVTTLSGGETFLTSLSLALALSEQIQLKGQSPLEFFFLDEGFGTLDQELLDSVMDSLEKLSSDERVIGIISHVPELKQRIGRRLIVTPPTYDGRGSRVGIEKA
jgi:exonuclease SbcC